MTDEQKIADELPVIGNEFSGRLNAADTRDFWVILAVGIGAGDIFYIEMSQDASECDILIENNWEDDNMVLSDGDDKPVTKPGVYKCSLHPWAENGHEGDWDGGVVAKVVETIWEPDK